MQTVERRTAYHWHCEECAKENFALPQKVEMTEQERQVAYRRFYDLEDWRPLPEGWHEFELVHIPEVVTCSECGATFRTIDERNA
jgi:ribosomal protein L37AE/L43A